MKRFMRLFVLTAMLMCAYGAFGADPNCDPNNDEVGRKTVAYFNEFMRGYYIAAILSLAVFSLIWFGEPVYLIVAGLMIIIPGVVLLIRFLRDHPLPPAEVSYD